jgi:hypothetical protein
MNFIPVVPALLFKAATTAVENMGFSPERVVEKSNVPLWQNHESHISVPGSHFYTLVGQAARILGAEDFGYLITRYTPITALDDFSQQLGQSLTVYEAVKTFNRLYAQMSSIDRFWSVEEYKRRIVPVVSRWSWAPFHTCSRPFAWAPGQIGRQRRSTWKPNRFHPWIG